MVLINEAAFALMEGLSTPEEIDQGMTLGYNHPMGPLALADFVGLDIYNGAGKSAIWRSFRKEGIENYFILTQHLSNLPSLRREGGIYANIVHRHPTGPL